MSGDTPQFGPLPRARVPGNRPLILASSSPRRRLLLEAAGYEFTVTAPADTAECGICSRETPPEMVARLAMQKAADVAPRVEQGMILGADTVAECVGHVLGKPQDRKHAEEMLRRLSGRAHSVYTGVCLWSRPENRWIVDVTRTKLFMEPLSEEQLRSYLDSHRWEGKAGAFGYQDGEDWLRVQEGSESNVVGLPMERLAELLEDFEGRAARLDPK